MTKTSSAFAKPITYDDAFITSVIPYGESDCIVRMLTRERGRLAGFCRRGRAFKKGSNAPQAPALAHVGFIAAEEKMVRLVSCELALDTMLASSVKLFAYRVYIAELIEKLLPEEDVAGMVFSLVEDAYAALLRANAGAHVLRSFELKLLDYCGYLPEMPTEGDEEDAIVAFDPLSCRFIANDNESSLAFSCDAIKLAKAMLIAKIGSVNYGEEYELLMIGRVFQSRLKVLGLYPLKSVAFLRQLSGR